MSKKKKRITSAERERREIRERISAICSHFNAVDGKPLLCDVEVPSLIGIENPNIVNVFRCSEDILWATIDGDNEPVDLSEVTVTDSLQLLLWELEEKYNIKTSNIKKGCEVITEGSLVRWHDPEIECQDLTIIWNVAQIRGDIVLIETEGGEAEVYADELELVK